MEKGILKKLSELFAALILVCSSLICGCQKSPQTSEETQPTPYEEPNLTLYIGTIANEPVFNIEKFHGIASYLSAKLKEHKINVVSTAAASIEEVQEMINNGQLHIFIDSPLICELVSKRCHLAPRLIRWKKGVGAYHSVFYVRADSEINTLEELKGRITAFEDQWSSCSYILPKAELHRRQIPTVAVKYSDTVPEDKAGYLFTEDDESSMLWLSKKRVDAACTNNREFQKIIRSRPDSFRVIYETEPIPRQVVAFSSTISSELRSSIEDILLEMEHDKSGQQVLVAFGKTKKFERIPELDSFSQQMNRVLVDYNRSL